MGGSGRAQLGKTEVDQGARGRWELGGCGAGVGVWRGGGGGAEEYQWPTCHKLDACMSSPGHYNSKVAVDRFTFFPKVVKKNVEASHLNLCWRHCLSTRNL